MKKAGHLCSSLFHLVIRLTVLTCTLPQSANWDILPDTIWIWLGSQALEIEIDQAPDADQRSRLKRIAGYVGQVVSIRQKELDRASELEKLGFSGFDAVHLAYAESGKAICKEDPCKGSESFGLAEGDDLMNIQTMTPQTNPHGWNGRAFSRAWHSGNDPFYAAV